MLLSDLYSHCFCVDAQPVNKVINRQSAASFFIFFMLWMGFRVRFLEILLSNLECERRRSRCSPRLVLPDGLWVAGGVSVHVVSFGADWVLFILF